MHRGARSLNVQMGLATAAIGLLALAALCGYSGWAMLRVDREAEVRERTLVSTALASAYDQMALAQTSVAIWNEAVMRTLALDQTWMSENLGQWFSDFYGADSVLVLDPGGGAVHAVLDRRTVRPAEAQPLAAALAPQVRDLRAKLAAAGPDGREGVMVQDAAIVLGAPSLISMVPILPDDRYHVLPNGQEYAHVAVHRLDGVLLPELGGRILVRELAFSLAPPEANGLGAVAITGSREGAVGYAVWRLDQPGRRMLAAAAPGLAIGGLAALALLVVLNLRLGGSAARLEASEAQARHLAFHDPLTGLPNRALFDARLGRALAACRRDGSRLALHYVDLDRFKTINDTLGHGAGDELIRAVAARFANVVRETDTVARIGGDEFAVIQTGLRGPEEAGRLAARLLAAASQPFRLLGADAAVGASIGVALAPDDASRRAEVMRKADIALYEAKEAGRGRLRFFSGETEAAALRNRGIEQGLRHPLDAE